MSTLKDDMIVEKSRFLLGMKAPNYELGELKVLDTYLARINARDPETKLVKFTKGEYEKLMGLKQIKPYQLKKHTQSLLGKVVTIPYGKKGWEQYTLFTHARCDQDEETLEWTVELGCNEKLESVFFNLEAAGYLRYRLKNIIPLTSKYSVLLYLYFKDNIFRQLFEITLRELREKLGVENNKTYESFKYFKRDIIDKCVEEINKHTDITVSYERKTRGRLTTGLVFTVKSKIPQISLEDMEQISFDELAATIEQENTADPKIALFREAITEGENFTDEQIDEFITVAKASVWYKSLPFHFMPFDREQALFEYFRLQDKYTRVHSNSKSGFYSYFKLALQNNYAKMPSYKDEPSSSFNTKEFAEAALKKSYHD